MDLPARCFLVAVLLGAGAGGARAGVCTDESEYTDSIKELERMAAGTGTQVYEYWAMCLGGDPRYRDRVTRACSKIIQSTDLDAAKPSRRRQVADECVAVLAGNGVTKVGAIDLVARLMKGGLPWNGDDRSIRDRFGALRGTKDPRIPAFVIEQYRANGAAVAGKTKMRRWETEGWLVWRLEALAALRELGTAAELPFVDEVIAEGKPPRLMKGARKAREAIAARRPAAPPAK